MKRFLMVAKPLGEGFNLAWIFAKDMDEAREKVLADSMAYLLSSGQEFLLHWENEIQTITGRFVVKSGAK